MLKLNASSWGCKTYLAVVFAEYWPPIFGLCCRLYSFPVLESLSDKTNCKLLHISQLRASSGYLLMSHSFRNRLRPSRPSDHRKKLPSDRLNIAFDMEKHVGGSFEFCCTDISTPTISLSASPPNKCSASGSCEVARLQPFADCFPDSDMNNLQSVERGCEGNSRTNSLHCCASCRLSRPILYLF